MFVCMYVCIYVCMYVCMFVCMFVCSVCLCVGLYVCLYVRMFVCMYALAVSQEEFVKKDGKDGFRGKCDLFCLYMVSRSFCKELGPLRAFGFVVVLLFCASFIYCITEMGWNTDLLIKGFFSCFLFCIHPVFVCNDST